MTFLQLEKNIMNARNLFDEFVENIRESNKKIFLFGAGLCGRSYLKIFQRKNIPLEGIIDNYKTSLDGHPVLRFETIVSNYNIEDCVIVITAPGSEDQIRKQVLSVFPHEQVFTFAITRYVIGDENEAFETMKFFQKNIFFLSVLYENFEDYLSKKVFCNVLIGRVTADKQLFASVKSGDFYYPPEIIKLDSKEILVELGSNNGDTLRDFISRCPKFKKVYCFEPDKACLTTLRSISNHYPDRIIIIPKIAWNKKCKLGFFDNGGDSTSYVCEDLESAGALIDASSVDVEINEPVTFIKMDIEGAELQALHGAENHIKQFKPKLAISVYHKRDDLVKIPQYLLSIRPDYRLYLRHHGNDDTDTVLYAI
ncbi:FkbM family methyltransferase [Agathobaculum sp. Marseille-P7918]|uniref:FkbM family methyltransferase n=1 Tax=Agathobaculum sp. Marseille-P7918 TaxID=2479843 RepID=UPI003562BDA4